MNFPSLRCSAVFICLLLAVAALPGATVYGQEQDVSQRKTLLKVAPQYPAFARQAQIAGVVRVRVEIRPDGTAGSEKVMGGHPVLAQAAVEALQKWKWAPGAETTTEVVEIRFDPK